MSARVLLSLLLMIASVIGVGGARATEPGDFPFVFETNQGQAPLWADYVVRRLDHMAFLSHRGIVVVVPDASGKQGSVLIAEFLSTRQTAAVDAVGEPVAKGHVYQGRTAQNWRLDVPLYQTVRYENLFSGIDLFITGRDGMMGYQFMIKPEGHEDGIRLRFQGTEFLYIDDKGQLMLDLHGGGKMAHTPPVTYEVFNNEKRRLPSRFIKTSAVTATVEILERRPGSTVFVEPSVNFTPADGGYRPVMPVTRLNKAANSVQIGGSLLSTGLRDIYAITAPIGSMAFSASVEKYPVPSRITYIGSQENTQGHRLIANGDSVVMCGATIGAGFPVIGITPPTVWRDPDQVQPFVATIDGTGRAVAATFNGPCPNTQP